MCFVGLHCGSGAQQSSVQKESEGDRLFFIWYESIKMWPDLQQRRRSSFHFTKSHFLLLISFRESRPTQNDSLVNYDASGVFSLSSFLSDFTGSLLKRTKSHAEVSKLCRAAQTESNWSTTSLQSWHKLLTEFGMETNNVKDYTTFLFSCAGSTSSCGLRTSCRV